MTQNDDFQKKKTALGSTLFQTKFMWGDRDEIIDFQRIKSRDLSYFHTEFMGAILMKLLIVKEENRVTVDISNGIY